MQLLLLLLYCFSRAFRPALLVQILWSIPVLPMLPVRWKI